MNIATAIMHIYPHAIPMKDFIVRDDSDDKGAYIAEWKLEEAQPTEEELKGAWEYIQLHPSVPELSLEEKITQLEDENAGLALELAQSQIRFDQSEQAQADLILALVEGGVL